MDRIKNVTQLIVDTLKVIQHRSADDRSSTSEVTCDHDNITVSSSASQLTDYLSQVNSSDVMLRYNKTM